MQDKYSTKIESLQALRGIAFLLILTYHCGIGIGGGFGVSIFLLLSGFLLAKKYYHYQFAGNGLIRSGFIFSLKHIRKLYPLHVFMSFVALPFLIFTALNTAHPVRYCIYRIILNLSLLQAWTVEPSLRYSLNNLSWYLSVCMFLYFLFPLLIQFLQKLNIRGLIITIISTFGFQLVIGYIINSKIGGGIYEQDIIQGLTYNFPLYRMGDFIIGVAFGIIYWHKNLFAFRNIRIYYVLDISATVLFIFVEGLAFYISRIGQNIWWCNTILYLGPSIIFIFLFTYPQGGVSKQLGNNKFLIWMGSISPYGFLIHEMIARYLFMFGRNEFDWTNQSFLFRILFRIIVLIVTFIGTILCCELYLFLDKRITAKAAK